MMRRWSPLPAAALAVAAAIGTARANIPPLPHFEVVATETDEPLPEERAAADVFARAAAAATPAAKLAKMDAALAGLPRPTRFHGFVQCSRVRQLAALGRAGEALAAARDCFRLRPDDPRALWMLGLLQLEAEPRVAARLLVAAVRADPSPLQRIDPAALASIARRLDYAGARDLRIELDEALAAAGQGGDASDGADQVLRDMRALLDRGDPVGAAARLARLRSTEAALELLFDRRYAALWPAAERWSAGTLRPQRDAALAAARAAFDAVPDLRRRLGYAVALTAAGRSADALGLLRAGIDARDGWDAQRFDLVATTAYAAGLMQGLGQGEAGLALLREIKAALPADLPARRNVAPNEARLLIALGRAREALALLDRETPAADQVEAAAALGHYAALRTCALAGAGRAGEARAAFVALRTRYATNRPALVAALRCAGTAAERRDDWLARLDDPEERDAALLAWARAARTGTAASPDSDEGDLARLADDPVLRARVAAFGRTLPASYDAALAGWPVTTAALGE